MTVSTPDWLRRRALGHSRPYPVTSTTAKGLGLEATLRGHTACVNTLDWNQSGTLLLSGSDDRSIIIWNPLKHAKQAQVQTGHAGNIFHAKFICNKSDTLLATCSSDAKVRVIDALGERTILNCDSCHLNRVKRLAIHQNQPDLIWSAGEDGRVMQYDLRQSHRCTSKNVFIDLNHTHTSCAAKCIATNPVRDEMLAVGGSDGIVRMYDRRLIKTGNLQLAEKCPVCYLPGQLNSRSYRNIGLTCGVTYVTFNPNGTQLLANLRSEQIYLYDLHHSNHTQISLPQLEKKCIASNSISLASVPLRHSQALDHLYTKALANNGCSEIGISRKFNMNDLNQINRLLQDQDHLFQLHQLKASALSDRNWRGDLYESMHESLKALSLNPNDSKSWLNLGYTVNHHENEEMALKLLELLKTLKDKYISLDEKEQAGLGCLDFSEIHLATNLLLQTIGIHSNPPTPIEELTFQYESCDMLDEIMEDADTSTDDLTVSRLKRTWNPKRWSDERSVKLNTQLGEVFDYSKRYCGHCNVNTDIKEANFFGLNGELILAGSDDGALYIWDRDTTNLVKAVQADMQIVNCVQAHPSISMFATSGIESDIKLWSPLGKLNKDVQALEVRCNQNEQFVSADPLDAMMMMFYPPDTRSRLN